MTNRIIKFINNMINDEKADHKQCNGRVSEIQEAISHFCSPEVFDKVNPLIQDELVRLIEAKHLETQDQLKILSYLRTKEAQDDQIIKFIDSMINDNETSRNNIIERVSQTQEAISHSCSSEVFDKVNPLIQDALVPLIEAKHLEAQEQLETLSHLVTHEDHNDNSDLSLFGCISNVFDLFSCGNDLDEA